MDNILSHDTPTTGPQTFFHPGITFDAKNYKISFSDAAKDEFQKIIDTIQSQLKLDQTENEKVELDTKNTPITPQIIDYVLDGMIEDGKGEKSINKLIERALDILGKKKKGHKAAETIEKIEKKVQKYSNQKCVEIIVGYTDNDKEILLKDTPIRVWEGQNIPTILNSLNTRLGFTQVISKAKKSSH